MDLLQGKLSAQVMEIVTRKATGLFPRPGQIHLDCSCPDWADMCKHVAAVLYGIGARLDESPELLFVLRGVDHLELIAAATQSLHADLAAPATGTAATLDEGSLAEVFGIDMDAMGSAVVPSPKAKPPKTPARAVSKSPKVSAGIRKAATRRPARKTPLAKSVSPPKKAGRVKSQVTKKEPIAKSVAIKSRKRRPAAK